MVFTAIYVPSFHYPKGASHELIEELMEIDHQYVRLSCEMALLQAGSEEALDLDRKIDTLIERRNALVSG